ncbi:MBL fold metallo-hydrolase [Aquabacterium sp. A08]|uniref:MBL fold metallo-hydrolase n=1 Tax=Aquabacterium sp. A08 TaxID=2718532 RepID=UPI0014214456|nr:MBL fold metallo-hydrolase [Aquabacterium sp. A08]NIC40607.1 MBL fold metallo-hydrolase [Aquabacterium sp. A08]
MPPHNGRATPARGASAAPFEPGRRRWLAWAGGSGLAAAGLLAVPEVRLFAQQVQDFIAGPPVPDVPAQRLSEHVWMVYAKDGFPNPENQGLMANVVFVVTPVGVVVLDSGCSLQIGEMALRMIRRVTDQPVVAIFNSHYHGDHWLGNHAFVNAYGADLPIYALPYTLEQIQGAEGNLWRSLMERWTNQATLGTKVVAPNRPTAHGQTYQFGDVTLKTHFYGRAHCHSDLCVEVVQDRLTYVADIAMDRRIANMDDGSYVGTFKYYEALGRAAGEQLWVPGHGRPSKTLLRDYGNFMAGIYEPCLKAVEAGQGVEQAKAAVLKDPRVARMAAQTDGFESNIGKYISLAYLEAEQAAF